MPAICDPYVRSPWIVHEIMFLIPCLQLILVRIRFGLDVGLDSLCLRLI